MNEKNENTLQSKVSDLIKCASVSQKEQFLFEILCKSSLNFERFDVLVKGQSSVASDMDMDEIVKDIRDTLESFDLEDVERFYDSWNGHGYKEEWEILRDGADDELDDIFQSFTDKIDSLLSVGNIIDGVKYFLALYEGVLSCDTDKMHDEYDVFCEGIKNAFFEKLKCYSGSFSSSFSKIAKEEDAVEKIINFVGQRIKKARLEKENILYNDLRLLKETFLALVTSKSTASALFSIIKESHSGEHHCNEVLLKIYSVLEKDEEWHDLAEKTYTESPEIARLFLESLENDRKTFVYHAEKLAFMWDGILLGYILGFMKKNDNPELYREILFASGKKVKSIEFYDSIKENYGKAAACEFMDLLKDDYSTEMFYVELLEYEKDYNAIKDFAVTHMHRRDFMDFLKPVLKVFPRECFYFITEKVRNELNTVRSRGTYRECGNWLTHLYSTEDKETIALTHSFVRQFTGQYKRRRAMHEEFRNAGLKW